MYNRFLYVNVEYTFEAIKKMLLLLFEKNHILPITNTDKNVLFSLT